MASIKITNNKTIFIQILDKFQKFLSDKVIRLRPREAEKEFKHPEGRKQIKEKITEK